MRIGSYELLISPRRFKQRRGIVNNKKYLDSIHSVAKTIGSSINWMVGGGLAIPLSFDNQFYREHSDIDLMIEVSDYPNLRKQLQADGYISLSRIAMTHISKYNKLELYKRVTDKEVVQKKPKNMRLIKSDRGEINHFDGSLLSYLDLFLFDLKEDAFILYDPPLKFPLVENLIGVRYNFEDGVTAPIMNISYEVQIKQIWDNIINKTDLEFILAHRI